MKRILISLLLLFAVSCSERTENISKITKLQDVIDSLEQVLRNEIYAPLVINNSSQEVFVGDTVSFDIGLLTDKLGLVDTLFFSIKKFNSEKDEYLKIDSYDRTLTNVDFEKENQNYLNSFLITDLEKGKYLLSGYVVYRDRKDDLRRYFVIKEQDREH